MTDSVGNALSAAFGACAFGLDAVSLKNEISNTCTINTVAFSTLATVSSGAYFFSTLDKIRIISLASFAILNNYIMWVGGGIVSGIRAWRSLNEFTQNIGTYNQSTPFKVRREIIMEQMKRLLTVAFLVCFAAWGVLSALHEYTAGHLTESLFLLGANQFLLCGFILCAATVCIYFLKKREI